VGTVKIGGMSEFEARDVLVKRLNKYFKDPQVTVRVQSYRSGRIYVDGEVRTPGLQSINDVPMTLPEVIGRAGGLGTLADRSAIAVTRDGATTLIDMNQLIEKGVNPNTILLKGGDLVRVMSREDSKVFVLGEVLKPSTQMLRHGRLSLGEALGDSGGVSPVSGDPRQIFVVRAGAKAERPEIYHLDASTPVAYALAEGFQLRSRDVVYVDPVPLVRWNRVISLILPSAQTLYTTRNTLN
jgi:polysaccharide biosynthesis/export protein